MDVRRFLAALKGRGVYRVAALYAAGSWALLQVADVFFPILGLPDWSITALLAAAALGFPIAIAFAWIFEINPQGSIGTTPSSVDYGRLKLSPARMLELILLVALVGLVGFLYVERLAPGRGGEPATSSTERPSIAVMAFENMSDDPSVEYFGDGLAEEILNLLAKLSELDLAARTSSFYYKGKDVDLRDVGRQLGVNHVLEGSVRRSGDRVRVTAQLIEMETGYHTWSETYDRDFSDSFRIEDEIARQVVGNLQVILSENSQEILDRRPTLVPEAYDYYLQGRDYLRSVPSDERLAAAVVLFERAIALDPEYAEGYAGLCDARLGQYRSNLDLDYFELAREACERALDLNHDAMPVYIALGNLYRYSGQYGASINEFNNALAINPSLIEALVGLGETLALDDKPIQAEAALERAVNVQSFDSRAFIAMGAFLFSLGRFEEAVPYFRRTTELMPDNFQAFNNLGAVYYMMGDLDRAAEAWQRSLSLQPNAVTYSNAGSSLFFLGRYREAAEMYQKAVEYAPEDYHSWGHLGDAYRFTDGLQDLAVPMYQNAIQLALERLKVNPSDAGALALVGHYYAASGNREQALLYHARATALAPRDMLVNYHSAQILSTLGELDQAMAALGRAVELGYSTDLVQADAGLAPLRDRQEYKELISPQPE